MVEKFNTDWLYIPIFFTFPFVIYAPKLNQKGNEDKLTAKCRFNKIHHIIHFIVGNEKNSLEHFIERVICV